VQLGFDNKKKATWAIVLGVLALLLCSYMFIPMFMGSPEAASSAQAAAPVPATKTPARPGKGKKVRVENLDPTLKLDLLASSEETLYEGSGRNIFVSQPDVVIPTPGASGVTDVKKEEEAAWHPPAPPVSPPIPLKFFGFASRPGEAKKVFLSLNDDVFVAGEGEIVNRRYKVVRISANSVEIQDLVSSGPPQNIPLTQG
jgi:hypothetical protein